MKKYTIIYALALGFILQGCTFSEALRTDPISPSDAPIGTLLSSCEVGICYTMGGNDARFNGMFTQYLTGTDRQHYNIGNFIFGQQDTDDTWDNYYRIMYNLKTIISKAGSTSPYYKGVAEVLLAICLGELTDLYGDIPYSNALKGTPEDLQPTYDSQEVIYGKIQELLDAAVVDLSASSNLISLGSSDLIYGGSTASWKSLAYALKARYYLHLSKKDASNYTNAITAVQNAAFADNSNNAYYGFTGSAITSQNPLFQFMDQRTDVRVCKTLTDTLIAENDPRTTFYVDTAGTGISGIVGAPAGESVGDANFPGPFSASADSKVFLLTYAELLFIDAEAKFQTGAVADAATAYNLAVKTSIVQVTGSDAPTSYTDLYASETSSTITLEKIMVQKWLAMYMSPEALTDWRRTGLPNLVGPSSKAIVRKWPYPTKEKNLNGGNVPSEGVFPIYKRVWWDVE